MNPSAIQAITFDAGGTLLAPWPSVGHVYAAVAAHHGWAVSPEILNRQFAAAWRARVAFDYSREAWADLVAQSFAGLNERSVSAELFGALYEAFAQPSAWRVFPDVRPTLEHLRARGLPLAVVSNWDERLPGLLDRLELAGCFQAIIFSRSVGATKPDRRIFDAAAATLGVPVQSILHVGDSLVEDVQGAEAAGLRAAWLNRVPDPGAPAIASIRTLAELVPPTRKSA